MKTPEDILQDALESERGIKITFTSHDEAIAYRVQCYGAIRSERARNKRELGDSFSEFDSLSLSVKANDLYIQPKARHLDVTQL